MMLPIFNRKPHKCPDCRGLGIMNVLHSSGIIENGKLVVDNAGVTLCTRCRGFGVISPVLDKYTIQELSDFIRGKSADDIIDAIKLGTLPKKV